MFHAFSPASETGRGRTLILRSNVGLSGPDPETRSSWVEIARCGEWKGHPAGEFKITPEILASVVAVFDAQANPVVLDYEHQSTDGAKAPAAGWIQKLEIRDGDRLWAFVEWTEIAAEEIRAGQYRFTSSVLLFGVPDRVTGEPLLARLHSVGATNCPFIDGLQPIALTEKVARTEPTTSAQSAPTTTTRACAEGKPRMSLINRKTVTDALKAAPSDSMTEEQWAAWIKAYLGAAVKPEPVVTDEADEDADEVAASDKTTPGGAGKEQRQMTDTNTGAMPAADAPAADPGAMLLARIAEASGMAPADVMAAIEANLDAILAVLKGAAVASTETVAATSAALSDAKKKIGALESKLAIAETKLGALEPTVRTLSDKLSARDKADADAAQAKRVAVIDALIASKQIAESSRDAWVKLSELAPDDFHASIKKSAFRVDLSDVPLGRQASGMTDPRDTNQTSPTSPRFIALSERFDRLLVAVPGETPEARKTRIETAVRSQLASEGVR